MPKFTALGAILILVLGACGIGSAEPTPSVTGKVQQYLLSPHGEVEGLLLADGTSVRFPPHEGQALAEIAKPGDEIAAVGFLGPATSYGRALKAITITDTATGQSLTNQSPANPPLPPDMRGLILKPLTVSGVVAHFLVNDAGDVDGLILNGGEEVKFGPHNGQVVAMMLCGQTGKTVEASGYGTQNGFGTVVDAMSLSVDGQAVPLSGPGRPRP
jgi:hypothetical protein